MQFLFVVLISVVALLLSQQQAAQAALRTPMLMAGEEEGGEMAAKGRSSCFGCIASACRGCSRPFTNEQPHQLYSLPKWRAALADENTIPMVASSKIALPPLEPIVLEGSMSDSWRNNGEHGHSALQRSASATERSISMDKNMMSQQEQSHNRRSSWEEAAEQVDHEAIDEAVKVRDKALESLRVQRNQFRDQVQRLHGEFYPLPASEEVRYCISR